MQQKDYKAIAEIITKVNKNTRSTDCNYIALELANYFDNIQEHGEIIKSKDEFNKKQFLKDCGVQI